MMPTLGNARTPGERFRQIKEEARRRAAIVEALAESNSALQSASEERERKMRAASKVLLEIQNSWRKSASTIDDVRIEDGLHLTTGDSQIIEAVSSRLIGFRYPICIYAHQDIDSGFFTFTCECDGESRRFPAQKIRDFDVEFAFKIFDEFLEWWAPIVTGSEYDSEAPSK